MILIDYNQVVISNLAMLIANDKRGTQELSDDLLRHMILNSIKSYAKQFKKEYGPEIIVCCDSRDGYWRRECFPYYKANRKKDRDASPIDWKAIFPLLNSIRDELKDVLPYKMLEVSMAEADDIIATLIKNAPKQTKKLIISGDKDFIQLQVFDNVKQWSPVMKKFIGGKTVDPVAYLKEHILRGDAGDGIPNFLSADDTFVIEGKRQTPLNSKKVEEWIRHGDMVSICNATTAMQHGYTRNQMLVNLIESIPVTLQDKIVASYNEPVKGSKQKMMKYCIEKRLKEILAELDLF